MWNRNEPHDVRAGLFGGHHAVRVWSLPFSSCAPFTVALACELEPAGTVGPHVQGGDAELVFVVAGEGVVVVNGEPRSVLPGAVAVLPLGATLAIENASTDQPLRYLIIKARPPAG